MRESGILMHITSLPSPYGIGTMGKAAYEFADFLSAAGQKLWQILPITPTGYGDSPYQTFSTFAGNPYLIDLDRLSEDGLLSPEDYENCWWGENEEQVDYALIYQSRFPVLRLAYLRFCREIPAEYEAFCRENAPWLEDYALFMALKNEHDGRPWFEWEDPLKFRRADAMRQAARLHQTETGFWKFLQFEFYTQWNRLKEYVNEQGIRLIGDIPIYVALDSADVWANPQMFELDEDLSPVEVAGCPPDYFSATGQLWGNPLYNWAYCKETKYDWWVRRIASAASCYDIIRIDHFRGFESFWAIPGGDETAVNGKWKKGPGIDLFQQIEEVLGKVPIIAEDLGMITDPVRELLKETGFPGMKVLEFAFSAGYESDYLPHRQIQNCVCYTGTHDNDTLAGWLSSLTQEDLEYVLDYIRCGDPANAVWAMIAQAWASPADRAITTMQDLLGLGSEARMNTPSQPAGNWSWRMKPGQLTEGLAKRLQKLTALYWR